MQSWKRDADVLLHIIREHITHWPSACTHPLCQNTKLEDEQSLYHHLQDIHDLRRTTGTCPKRVNIKEQISELRVEQQNASGTLQEPKPDYFTANEKCINHWESDPTLPGFVADDGREVRLLDTTPHYPGLDIPLQSLEESVSWDHPEHSSLDAFMSEYISIPSTTPSIAGDSMAASINTAGAEIARPRIKLHYKRPKIILRLGAPSNSDI